MSSLNFTKNEECYFLFSSFRVFVVSKNYAITGRYPKFGLYLDQNRKAEVLIKCGNLAENILADPSFYPLLGYLAGHEAGNKVVAIEGKVIRRDSSWLP